MSDGSIQVKKTTSEVALECHLDDLACFDPLEEYYDYEEGLCVGDDETPTKTDDVDKKKALANRAKSFKKEEKKPKKVEQEEEEAPSRPLEDASKKEGAILLPVEIRIQTTSFVASGVLASAEAAVVSSEIFSLPSVDISSWVYLHSFLESNDSPQNSSRPRRMGLERESIRELEREMPASLLGLRMAMGERVVDDLIKENVDGELVEGREPKPVSLAVVQQIAIERDVAMGAAVIEEDAVANDETISTPLLIPFSSEASKAFYVGREREMISAGPSNSSSSSALAVFRLEQMLVIDTNSQVFIVLPPAWVTPKEKGGAGHIDFKTDNSKLNYTKVQRGSQSQGSNDGNQTGSHGQGKRQQQRYS